MKWGEIAWAISQLLTSRTGTAYTGATSKDSRSRPRDGAAKRSRRDALSSRPAERARAHNGSAGSGEGGGRTPADHGSGVQSDGGARRACRCAELQREEALLQRERELAEQRRVLAEEYRLLRSQRAHAAAAAAPVFSGDRVQVPAKHVPHFKAGKELRERVDGHDATSSTVNGELDE